ncbi:hypothetical protein [Aeromonas rivipollensis]|uniref:hypothetical protein n=1 Tax=Aeromonas rivipollensis TaxID=948519 RepID=UPI001F173E0B|nr:hypothetical protein [Aeromonas rivipollensis]MCE9954559.1 hypothetical protein [Aeromonas rivipollensis]
MDLVKKQCRMNESVMMSQAGKSVEQRMSGFMIQDTVISSFKCGSTEQELVTRHQVANPVDTKGELRAASTLCAMLTLKGDDISPYGLKFMEHWLRTLEEALLDCVVPYESACAEGGDDQRKQQIIKRWTQRIADAHHAVHGDFNRIGEVIIHISNEKFHTAIKDFLRHPPQEHNEDHNLEKRRGLTPATRASSTPSGYFLHSHS